MHAGEHPNLYADPCKHLQRLTCVLSLLPISKSKSDSAGHEKYSPNHSGIQLPKIPGDG